jgi:probable dihydroxyacetone kinase regulator
VSQTTKKALAASLKKLLAQKPLDKITVVDIVTDCEVNRQTFYYHFQDIYDLVEWVFLSESTKIIGENKNYDTWQEGFLRIFEYAQENKPLIQNTYHSISRGNLEQFLYKETYHLLIGVIEEKAEGMSVREEDKAFIADFYKYAFVGLLLEWVRTGMKEKPADIVGRLSVLIHGDITKALGKYRTDWPVSCKADG